MRKTKILNSLLIVFNILIIASLIIALIRNLMPTMLAMKEHNINYEQSEGRLLNNLKIGIIGCGEIGSAVAKIDFQVV